MLVDRIQISHEIEEYVEAIVNEWGISLIMNNNRCLCREIIYKGLKIKRGFEISISVGRNNKKNDWG